MKYNNNKVLNKIAYKYKHIKTTKLLHVYKYIGVLDNEVVDKLITVGMSKKRNGIFYFLKL
jgi:hypothetical protein